MFSKMLTVDEPWEKASPAANSAAEMTAPAKGPAAATSKRSVRFLAMLFSCVMAPKLPS